jgi:gliding motility-associated-like protein
MGGQMTYETIDLDTLRGIFQITLRLERPCSSAATFNPDYLIKVLEYDSKRNPGYNLSVYAAKLYDSSYIYYPCTPASVTCASAGGQVIEVKYYRVQIVVQNSDKECVVYFDENSYRTYSDNLLNYEDPMLLYTSFIPKYANTQVHFTETKRHFPLKDKLTQVGYTINDTEGDSLSFKTSLPFKSLSYSATGTNLNYTLSKSLGKAGLHDNKPFFILETSLTTTSNTIQFTPSVEQSSWLTLVKSEFRKINLGIKDTWICISKSNADRLFSIYQINSQFNLDKITSSQTAVKINGNQITICNNNTANSVQFHFPIETAIQANKYKIFLGQTEVSSQFTTNRKLGAGGIDTLVFTFNYTHPGTDDLTLNLKFDFELCHTANGIGFDRSITVPFHVFNHNVFLADTILSCTTNLSIPTLISKSITVNWGNYSQTNKTISISNPKDTWIVVQLNSPNINCPSKDSIYVNQGSIFSITTYGYLPSCKGYSDASAKVVAIGTNGPFTYRWSNSSTFDSIASIPAGMHIVEVSDKDNCKQKDTLKISDPQGIEAKWVIDSQVTCFGGSNGSGHIQVTSILKPSQYTWTSILSVDSFLNNISSGNYLGSYRYTNLSNIMCDQPFSFFVPQPDSIFLHIVKTDNTCFGETKGKIAVLPLGGYGDFLFYFNSIETSVGYKDNLGNGTVDIYVKDYKNCQSSTQSIVINSPSKLKYSIVANNPSCAQANNGLLSINHPNGGVSPYMFSFSHGNYENSMNFNNLGIGTYNIKMRDANNCIFSQNFTLNPSYILQAKPNLLEDSKCPLSNSGKIHLDILNGASPYQIYYQSDSTVITNTKFQLDSLAKGNYAIHIVDNNNCSWLSQYQISEPDTLTLISTVKHESCFGMNDGILSAQIINGGTAPYSSLSWYNESNSLLANSLNLSPGKYFLRLKDSKNCDYEYKFSILGKPELKANLLIENSILCHGYATGKIKSFASGGVKPYRFLWRNFENQTTNELLNLSAGGYFLEIKDADNCNTIDSTYLPQPNPIQLESLKIKNSDCPNIQNGAMTIKCINSLGNSSWLEYRLKNKTEYTSANTFSNLAKDLYTIQVKDSLGCVKEFSGEIKTEKTLSVQLPTSLSFELGEERLLTPVISFGENTTQSDINGYDWNPKYSLSCTDCLNPKYTATKSETYTFEINYGNSCKSLAAGNFEVSKAEDLFIPNSFSPNGDDKNDIWYVFGKNIIGCDIKVFNRVGELVYSSSDIQKGWDGNYLGKKETTNTYKYQIKVTYADWSQRFYEGSLNLFR